jgi:hypothetical protein
MPLKYIFKQTPKTSHTKKRPNSQQKAGAVGTGRYVAFFFFFSAPWVLQLAYRYILYDLSIFISSR